MSSVLDPFFFPILAGFAVVCAREFKLSIDLTRTDLSGSLLADPGGSVDLGCVDLGADDDDVDGFELVDLRIRALIRCRSFFPSQSPFSALIAPLAASFPDNCAMEYSDAGSKDGYAGLLTRGLLDLASWATKDGMTWNTLYHGAVGLLGRRRGFERCREDD